MGFSVSGRIATGAQDELLQLLAQRRLEEQMQQQARAQAIQQALQQAQLAQRAREHQDSLGLNREQMTQQQNQFDATRRERRNIEGLQQMNIDREAWEREKAPPKRTVVTTIGPRGRPIKKAVTDEELTAGIPEYREPSAPVRDPIADYEAKKQIDAKYKTPDGPSPYSDERGRRVVQSVDELIGKVNNWTSGVGSVLANLPATDARNFAAELNTLKSNIAFNELTEMREASKTGGALGQVSNIELVLLESALGALDPGQSPENLRANLAKIRESVQKWQQAKAGAAAPSLNLGTIELVRDENGRLVPKVRP